jgi:hypothetical protein
VADGGVSDGDQVKQIRPEGTKATSMHQGAAYRVTSCSEKEVRSVVTKRHTVAAVVAVAGAGLVFADQDHAHGSGVERAVPQAGGLGDLQSVRP